MSLEGSRGGVEVRIQYVLWQDKVLVYSDCRWVSGKMDLRALETCRADGNVDKWDPHL